MDFCFCLFFFYIFPVISVAFTFDHFFSSDTGSAMHTRLCCLVTRSLRTQRKFYFWTFDFCFFFNICLWPVFSVAFTFYHIFFEELHPLCICDYVSCHSLAAHTNFFCFPFKFFFSLFHTYICTVWDPFSFFHYILFPRFIFYTYKKDYHKKMGSSLNADLIFTYGLLLLLLLFYIFPDFS